MSPRGDDAGSRDPPCDPRRLPCQSHRSKKAPGGRPEGRPFSGISRGECPGHRSGRGRAAGVVHEPFRLERGVRPASPRQILFDGKREDRDRPCRNDSLPPLDRLRSWLDAQIDFLRLSEFRSGCLIGNFTMEAGGQCIPIRDRLRGNDRVHRESHRHCLQAAVDAGEIPASVDVGTLAGFIYSSWQGAVLQAKVEQNADPLERFKTVLFCVSPALTVATHADAKAP